MCRLIPYKNKKIADIKLHHINNIVEQAQNAPNISRIMLFGSSLEEKCSKKSDIDIAVFGIKSKSRYIDSGEFKRFKRRLFSFDWDQDYDVLYFVEDYEYTDSIMDDIKNGVEIYRKEKV